MNEISIDRELERKLRLAQSGEITWVEYNSFVMAALRKAFPPHYASSDMLEKNK